MNFDGSKRCFVKTQEQVCSSGQIEFMVSKIKCIMFRDVKQGLTLACYRSAANNFIHIF